MINKNEFQNQINRRLSGITASDQRRMRILAAVDLERSHSQPMRKPLSQALILAVIVTILIATIAFAEYFNLFNFFGEYDKRYNSIAPYATITITEPVLVEYPDLRNATASIDSAYFDGLSLNLAYRITQGQKVDEYTPNEAELALMKKVNPDKLVVAILENEPGIDVLGAWNQAILNRTPYGYRKTAIYISDHTTTDDGVEISPDSASPMYNKNGEFCEMREFECPLPNEIRNRHDLKINNGVCQITTYYWFDGTNCFWRTENCEVGTMTAVVPRNGEIKYFSGTGKIGSATCNVNADVSPMASIITFKSDFPLNTFLTTAPEGTDEYDCWVEVTPVDENGHIYSQKEIVSLDDRTGFTLSFIGTGALPDELTVYVYSMWEGIDEPDINTLDGISLKACNSESHK